MMKNRCIFQYIWQFFALVGFSFSLSAIAACQSSSFLTESEEITEGITTRSLRLGSVLALEGQEEALGNQMKVGLEAALKGQEVKGRKIEILFENDFYEPPNAMLATQDLINAGIFFAIGNVGTPTTKVTLPLLTDRGVPAVGFFTGSHLLRSGSREELIVNYRASYTREIETVVRKATDVSVKPEEICAYVQNDSYGMAGLAGLKQALEQVNAPSELLKTYEAILDSQERNPANAIAPIGLYTRNTPDVLPGYESLKSWEQTAKTQCKLVITAGAYSNIARFVKLSREKGENWIVSALSFTGADNFQLDLEEYGVTQKVIMTQVVPLLHSNLPIVKEAKSKLADEFGFVSLEGYIVGKMTLEILNQIPGELNRKNFMEQVARAKFDLGGVEIDFTKNANQGSNLVVLSYLTPRGFQELRTAQFKKMLP
ncbi:MAG: ABC transporter substrate-binding protein [Spirulina sp.]